MNNASPSPNENASDSFGNGFCCRLQEVIAKTATSQNEFARKLGTTPGYISNIVRGKSRPGFEFIEQIARTFHLDLNWLMLGEGRMEREVVREYDYDWYKTIVLRGMLVDLAFSGNVEAQTLLAELMDDIPRSDIVTEARDKMVKQVLQEVKFANYMGVTYAKFPSRDADLKEVTRSIIDLYKGDRMDRLSTMAHNSSRRNS